MSFIIGGKQRRCDTEPKGRGVLKPFRFYQFLLMALLCAFSITITVYTIKAYSVARHVYDGEYGVYWRCYPPGSFFPWPKEPEQEGVFPVLTKMSQIDLFVYQYLIKTRIIIIVALLLWVATCTYIIKRLILKPTFQSNNA